VKLTIKHTLVLVSYGPRVKPLFSYLFLLFQCVNPKQITCELLDYHLVQTNPFGSMVMVQDV